MVKKFKRFFLWYLSKRWMNIVLSVWYTMLSQLEIVKKMNQSYSNIIYFWECKINVQFLHLLTVWNLIFTHCGQATFTPLLNLFFWKTNILCLLYWFCFTHCEHSNNKCFLLLTENLQRNTYRYFNFFTCVLNIITAVQ